MKRLLKQAKECVGKDKLGEKMPHISLSLYSGRKKEEIDEISSKLHKALVNLEIWQEKDISVSVDQIAGDKYVERVNEKIAQESLNIPSDYIK